MDAARILRIGPHHGARPGPAAIGASVLLHGALALAAWLALSGKARIPPAQFRVYRVHIVSPPPQAYGPPTLAPPVVRPSKQPEAKAPAAAPPKPTVKVAPDPRAKPPAKAPAKVPAKAPEKPADAGKGKAADAARAKAGAQAPAKGWNPHPDAVVGGSGINVQLEGEEFPYPAYLQNIIVQISRFFRWNGSADRRAEAYFVINRDGSVQDIRVLRGSGDWQFDLTVRGAIESAGRRRAFGALPRGFQGDRLPISFYFQPAR